MTTTDTVLFDLDGTLVDTAPDMADALNRIQKNIHLAQVKRSDVWQWQLPPDATEPAARAPLPPVTRSHA